MEEGQLSKWEPSEEIPIAAERSVVNSALEPLIERAERAVLAGDLASLRALVGQLWPDRLALPELLTRRLIEGRTRAPLLTLELLGGFAGRAAAPYLRRVAEDPAVADLVRWSARRRLGWPARGQARWRLAFLASLRDPDRTLVEAVAQATTAWPPDSELLDEVLAYLCALPSPRRQGVLQRIAGHFGVQAGWLLHAALFIDDAATQRLALAEIGRLRPPGAAGAVARLAASARTATMRAAAAAAAQRLRLRLVDGAGPASAPLPPLTQALLSAIDGAGHQLACVVRQWPDGLCLVVHFLLHAECGVKAVVGLSRTTADLLASSLASVQERGLPLVAVDLPALRGVLQAALERCAAGRRRLPPSFELWEPALHDHYPPPPHEPVASVHLDDAAYGDRPDLLRASVRLAEHPFFQSWCLSGKASALALGVAGEARAWLRERLRQQAWLLERAGDLATRDVVLAVAAQLATAPEGELARQPFLRRLAVRRAVAVGGLALPWP